MGKRIKKIIGILFLIFIIIVSSILIYWKNELDKIKVNQIIKTDKELGIKPKVRSSNNKEHMNIDKCDIEKKIINIALFGIDRREAKEPCRSDAIMIISIDNKHKKIKVTSIMRDTYVKIKDYGMTKINHAYAYGGPQLAIRTLNENFNLDIREYAAVDFFAFEDLVNMLDGVEIDISSEEVKYINSIMVDISKIENKTIVPVIKSGIQTLNGMQTVAYSRIRSTSGGDYVRTERQRTVISALMKKIQTLDKKDYIGVITKMFPYIETSMSKKEILKLAMSVSNSFKIEKKRFPLDEFSKGKIIDGVWYLVTDLEATEKQIKEFVYND